MRAAIVLATTTAIVFAVVAPPRSPSVHREPEPTMIRIEPLDGPAFLLARCETSVGEYAEFVAWIERTGDHSRCDPREGAGRSHRPQGVRAEFLGDPEAPVVGVDWFDAVAYAAWRGRRLPTAYEWIRAAQACGLAPGAWDFETGAPIELPGRDVPLVPGMSVARLTAVGPGACLDLAGSVSEWCVGGHPVGAEAEGGAPVLGGNWYLNARAALTTSRRARSYRHSTVGFRCAADVADDARRRWSAGIVLKGDPEAGR